MVHSSLLASSPNMVNEQDIVFEKLAPRTVGRKATITKEELFQATLNHQDLTASLVPMSDGLLMIRKNSANITLEIEEI